MMIAPIPHRSLPRRYLACFAQERCSSMCAPKNLSVLTYSIFLPLKVICKCEGIGFDQGDLKSIHLVFDVLINNLLAKFH